MAEGDQPLPLAVGEQALPARIVGRRIGAAEELGEQSRREVIVRGASGDPGRRPPGPAQHERRAHLIGAERGAVPGEALPVLVELRAVIGGEDDHGALEQLPALQVVEDPPHQRVHVADVGQVARVSPRLLRGVGGKGRCRQVGDWLVGGDGVVVEKAEEGA